jgi:hypothetical protein
MSILLASPAELDPETDFLAQSLLWLRPDRVNPSRRVCDAFAKSSTSTPQSKYDGTVI